MPTITCTQVLTALETDWATYVARFHQLDPSTQSAWLAAQGYACFPDLLAHVLAWWAAGETAIHAMLADPAWTAPPVDVDTFNAAAVARWQTADAATVVSAFEAQRQALVDLVAGLPAPAQTDARILARLEMEVIGHLAEHALPG